MIETVRRLPPDEAVAYMVAWFRDHYQDPVESMPWDGGDYVWLVEQCDASEELSEAFVGVPDELIARAVATIEEDGWQWVRLSDLDKMGD